MGKLLRHYPKPVIPLQCPTCNEWRAVRKADYLVRRSDLCRRCNTRAVGKARTKHGYHNTPTYHSWRSMKKRCYQKAHDSYPRYGGRGIQVCAEWKDSFETFLADMGVKPAGMSLDRIDPDGDYEPANCRWATFRDQVLHRDACNPPRERDEKGRYT